MDRLIRQGSDMLNSNTAQIVAFGTASGNWMFFDYLALWVQVASAILVTVMAVSAIIKLYSTSTKLYKDWRKK